MKKAFKFLLIITLVALMSITLLACVALEDEDGRGETPALPNGVYLANNQTLREFIRFNTLTERVAIEQVLPGASTDLNFLMSTFGGADFLQGVTVVSYQQFWFLYEQFLADYQIEQHLNELNAAFNLVIHSGAVFFLASEVDLEYVDGRHVFQENFKYEFIPYEADELEDAYISFTISGRTIDLTLRATFSLIDYTFEAQLQFVRQPAFSIVENESPRVFYGASALSWTRINTTHFYAVYSKMDGEIINAIITEDLAIDFAVALSNIKEAGEASIFVRAAGAYVDVYQQRAFIPSGFSEQVVTVQINEVEHNKVGKPALTYFSQYGFSWKGYNSSFYRVYIDRGEGFELFLDNITWATLSFLSTDITYTIRIIAFNDSPAIFHNGSLITFARYSKPLYVAFPYVFDKIRTEITFVAPYNQTFLPLNRMFGELFDTLPIPVPPLGNNFVGWYTAEVGGQRMTANSRVPNQEKIILFARFELLQFTITYNTGGGSHTNQANFTIESEFVFEAASRVGYTFVGWFEDASLTQSITRLNRGTASNLEIFASFVANIYTVYLNLSGGVGGVSYVRATFNQTMPELLVLPTKQFHNFLGFFNESGNVMFYNANLLPVSNWTIPYNYTLFARWEIFNFALTSGTAPNIADTNIVILQGPEWLDGTTIVYNDILFALNLFANTAPARALTLINLRTGEVEQIVHLAGNATSLSLYGSKLAILVADRHIFFFDAQTRIMQPDFVTINNININRNSAPFAFYKNYIYYASGASIRRFCLNTKQDILIYTKPQADSLIFALDVKNSRLVVTFAGRFVWPHTTESRIRILNLSTNQMLPFERQGLVRGPLILNGQFILRGSAYSTIDGSLITTFFDVTFNGLETAVVLQTDRFIVFSDAIFNRFTQTFDFVGPTGFGGFVLSDGHIVFTNNSRDFHLMSTFGFPQSRTIVVDYRPPLDLSALPIANPPTTPNNSPYIFARSNTGNAQYIDKRCAQTGQTLSRVHIITTHTGGIINVIGEWGGYLYLMGSVGAATPPSARIIYKINIAQFETKIQLFSTTSVITNFFLVDDRIFTWAGSTMFTINLHANAVTSRNFGANIFIFFDKESNLKFVQEMAGARRLFEICLTHGAERAGNAPVTSVSASTQTNIMLNSRFIFIETLVICRESLTLFATWSTPGTSSNVFMHPHAVDDNFIVNRFWIKCTRTFRRIYFSNNVLGAVITSDAIYLTQSATLTRRLLISEIFKN
ncbi:MAG: InlB B-repeat-containing protein [Firmicutes bacterium]|nr:InlB B-repeat-containing protein [Bacillota bacterium]